MKELLEKYIHGKKVLILGFGREGRSTYHYLRTHFPDLVPAIADQDAGLDTTEIAGDHQELFLGPAYLDAVKHHEVIFKSPGIDLRKQEPELRNRLVLTQTALFLESYRNRIVGVTGTKGKSTTASLIFHILKSAGREPLLVGNIGLPPFDYTDRIRAGTPVVFEMSAHQLAEVHHSPHIAVLLNIFQEHLDFFGSLEKYAEAKMQIAKYQDENDFLIANIQNPGIRKILPQQNIRSQIIGLPTENTHGLSFIINGKSISLPVDQTKLHGNHNRLNMAAAAAVCLLLDVPVKMISEAIRSFIPLEHRLEFAGTFCGIKFYNDSIATIPEATISAVESLPGISTLILGGFDRGIDYHQLIEFLKDSAIQNFVFTGPAGQRMMKMFEPAKRTDQRCFAIADFDELPQIILKHTPAGSTCLLSPAASSYDAFKDFAQRGDAYKKMARTLGDSCHS